MSSCCTPQDDDKRTAQAAVLSSSTPSPAGDGVSMVRLAGGTFLMGGEDADANPLDGEGPIREVTVSPFLIARHAVTNAEFAAFVDATGYRTGAERYGWSFVFASLLPGRLRKGAERPQAAPWWCRVEGAYWAAPEGPGSGITERADHPVVHVDHHDAQAFCRWAGLRLPTEAEWEYAARGGLVGKRYPWGDELIPSGQHRCNIWQGRFPTHNTLQDGYFSTAPAQSFQPNGYGLYNMSGNVWEWCADWWGTDHDATPTTDPTGPSRGSTRVMRGGSYLCHDSYCNRYRVAARTSNDPSSCSGNLGFRCAND
jgi:formylglycine-generating enzyme required for sulfatase activity